MEKKTEIGYYIECLEDKKKGLSQSLSDCSRLNIFIRPFATINRRMKLRKVMKLDSEFTDTVAVSLGSEDYKKRVLSFIDMHPINKI